jgi:site-specific recombinase XerD
VQLEKAATYHLTALRGDNRAASTIGLYALVHRTYIAYVRESLGQPPLLAHLSVATVRDFQAWLRDRPARTPNAWQTDRSVTVRQFTKILKTWSRFLARDLDVLFPNGDPLAKLGSPKATSRVPMTVSRQQFDILLAMCAKTQRPLRNQAILKLFVESGLRNAELCSLRLADVEFATPDRAGRVLVMGKGNTQRHVGFGTAASKALALYLKLERKHPESPWLFLGVRDQPMTPDAVRHVFQVLYQEAGLPRIHPHALRTTFATWRAKAGQNAFALQQQLGHSKIEQTSRYVQLAAADIQDTYISMLDGATPRAQPLGQHCAGCTCGAIASSRGRAAS